MQDTGHFESKKLATEAKETNARSAWDWICVAYDWLECGEQERARSAMEKAEPLAHIFDDHHLIAGFWNDLGEGGRACIL